MNKMSKALAVLLLGVASLSAENMVVNASDINDIVVEEDKLPDISKKKLEEILATKGSLSLNDLIVYEKSKMKKNSLGAKKQSISFDSLLKAVEKRHRMYSLDDSIIYLAKDKMLTTYLTKEQYASLLDTLNIQAFIQKFNNYTGLNFTSKVIYNGNNEKIIYIGNYANAIVDDAPIVKYIMIADKTGEFHPNTSCSEFEKAFYFYKNFHGTSSSVHFDLTPIEVTDLYIKLFRWHVNVASFNNLLLDMFQEKTQYIKNFNFEQAFYDLKKNPSYTTASNIREDLLKIKNEYSDNETDIKMKSFIYDKPERISKILEDISKVEGSEYVLNERYCSDITIPVLISNDVVIRNFADFKNYLKKATKYDIEVTTNKYILSAEKTVVVYQQRDIRHQALHYLDEAINEVVKSEKQNFSTKAFVDDIESIKGEY